MARADEAGASGLCCLLETRGAVGVAVERNVGRGAWNQVDCVRVQVGRVLEARILVLVVALLLDGQSFPVRLHEGRELRARAELADTALFELRTAADRTRDVSIGHCAG